MHHYGEDAIEVRLADATFRIDLHNHHTDAVVSISGPRVGVFEDENKMIGENEVHDLAREFAHLMRRVTGDATMGMGA